MKFSDYGLNAYLKNAEEVAALSAESSQKDKSGKEPVKTVRQEAVKNGGLLKVPLQPDAGNGKDSVYRRVAKFLMLIGVDEAAKILPHLSPAQVEKIIPELACIRSIDKAEAALILEEFKSLTEKARESGGVNTARTILEKAFGSQKAGELIEKTVPFKNGKPFEYLCEADGEKLSLLLKDESASVRALDCSHLPPKKAADFINRLPDAEKAEVIVRLSKLTKMSPDIVAKIDEALQKKLNSLVTEKSDSIDGKSVLARILKQMDSSNEEKLLEKISSSDPALSEELRERIFTFDDIINADDKFLQKKLQQMSDEEIAFVIHYKKEEFRKKILFNVSENRRKTILEEEDRHTPMRKIDVEKATSLFFASMRRAWEEGKLFIKGRNDEIYV